MIDARQLMLTAAVMALAAGGTARAQDYRVYAANEYDANVTVIDPKTETAIGSIKISGRPGDVRPRGMAVSPDGKTVYISVSDFLPRSETPEDAIVAIDVAKNEVAKTYRAGGNPERVAISPDGKQIWAALEATAQAVGIDAATGAAQICLPSGLIATRSGLPPAR